jgi:hypothetical protein
MRLVSDLSDIGDAQKRLRIWIASAEHLYCGKREPCLCQRNIVGDRSLLRIDAIASVKRKEEKHV